MSSSNTNGMTGFDWTVILAPIGAEGTNTIEINGAVIDRFIGPGYPDPSPPGSFTLNPWNPGALSTINKGALFIDDVSASVGGGMSLTQYLVQDSDNPITGASGEGQNNSVGDFNSDQTTLDQGYGGFSISDTAANVSGAIDALNADGSVNAITLTDSGAPTLSLSAAQAVNDTTALNEFTNADYSIVILDDAANVSAHFDMLSVDSRVSSITLTDAGAPTLALSAQQALADTAALGKITNANYSIGISDTAADVSPDFDALDANLTVSSITLTDSGTPTLNLTVSRALGDTTALGEITNSDYAISISDTAANILANAMALSADLRISGVTVVDTAANVLANASALTSASQVIAIAIVDTAANILANAVALDDNAQVTSITAVDSAANILENSAALAALPKLSGQIVSDTATNVSSSIDALNSDFEPGSNRSHR